MTIGGTKRASCFDQIETLTFPRPPTAKDLLGLDRRSESNGMPEDSPTICTLPEVSALTKETAYSHHAQKPFSHASKLPHRNGCQDWSMEPIPWLRIPAMMISHSGRS
jgi:hypothetical protein